MKRTVQIFIATILSLVASQASGEYMQPRDQWPQIVAHRGASGYLPEHSINGYQLAIDLGADYVEPDLCLSKDAVFVCIHDLTLDGTTDIASHPEFADRKKADGFYVSDFTLEELKTLRLKQRSASRTHLADGDFTIPTFQELTDLMWSNYGNTSRMVGIYPELKDPVYHNALGYPESMEQMLVDQLGAAGYQTKGCTQDMKQVNPVAIQCFEGETLRNLSELTDIPKLMLIQQDFEWSEVALEEIAEFAQAVGPNKNLLEGDTDLETARVRVQQAHDAGLVVHPWTVKQDTVPAQFNGSAAAEGAYLYCCLGVDGTFCEYPDRMRQTLDELELDPEGLCAMANC